MTEVSLAHILFPNDLNFQFTNRTTANPIAYEAISFFIAVKISGKVSPLSCTKSIELHFFLLFTSEFAVFDNRGRPWIA